MDKPKISFLTDRLYIRSVKESDKEEYMALRIATSELAEAYESNPAFGDHEWKYELNSSCDIYLSVFMIEPGIFVASGSFQSFDSDTIELGCDVVEAYRNLGIATELVTGMIRTAHTVFPGKAVKIRTNVANGAARRVAEKCGGLLSGYEPTPAAKAIASLSETINTKWSNDTEWLQMKEGSIKFVEENKEGVCVYYFEQ